MKVFTNWGSSSRSYVIQTMRNDYATQRDICTEMKSLAYHIAYAKVMGKIF